MERSERTTGQMMVMGSRSSGGGIRALTPSVLNRDIISGETAGASVRNWTDEQPQSHTAVNHTEAA